MPRRKRRPRARPAPLPPRPRFPGEHGLTLARFRILERALLMRGYESMIEWSETVEPPKGCRAFAREAIYVICNSGMRVTVANMIYWRCVHALNRGDSSTTVFGHPGKAAAIDYIWANRRRLWKEYQRAPNKVGYCLTLPFVGRITQHHLAKNLGVNTVKPDVHLDRLAKAERITAWDLCTRLAKQTGYREATIDVSLWRACADRILNSAAYLGEGWREALDPDVARLVRLKARRPQEQS